jgi:hypothetical protein
MLHSPNFTSGFLNMGDCCRFEEDAYVFAVNGETHEEETFHTRSPCDIESNAHRKPGMSYRQHAEFTTFKPEFQSPMAAKKTITS